MASAPKGLPAFAISAQVSQRDLDRVVKRLDKMQGAELAKRVDKAARGGMTLFVSPMRRAAPAPGHEKPPADATGNLRASIGVWKLKKRSGEIVAYAAGPHGRKGSHRHLVIRGHDIVRGGKTFGFVKGNPFLDPVINELEGPVVSFIENEVRRLA